jgi:hypothetical protein
MTDAHKLILDEHGGVEEPPLHDGSVLGIFYDFHGIHSGLAREFDLLLQIWMEDGTRLQLEFCSCQQVHFDGLERQNIIFDCLVLEGERLTDTELASAMLSKPASELSRLEIERCRSIEGREELRAVRFSSSVGAEITVVCKSVGWREGWTR